MVVVLLIGSFLKIQKCMCSSMCLCLQVLYMFVFVYLLGLEYFRASVAFYIMAEYVFHFSKHHSKEIISPYDLEIVYEMIPCLL